MVRPLRQPPRPLPGGGATWVWRWRGDRAGGWQWCRVYHRGVFAPSGQSPRTNGPRARLDPHTPPSDAPAEDPAGRSVLYVGDSLATSACEVFGAAGEARICPSYRVALLRPVGGISCFDLTAAGSAMTIGALPSLADGAYPRSLTQDWARAIYEDDPTGQHVDGIRYTSAYNGGRSLALWEQSCHPGIAG